MTSTVISSSMPMPAKERWNSWAVPWKLAEMPVGSGSWLVSLAMASIAWPMEIPGLRLKEMVTEGNWPVWVIDSGPVASVSFTSSRKGINWPVAERTYNRSSALLSVWSAGRTPSNTRYWASAA